MEILYKYQIIYIIDIYILPSSHLTDLNELVIIIRSMEERLLLEDHSGEHAAQRPHVQAVVVLLEVHQQLGALEVPGRHAHIVLLS